MGKFVNAMDYNNNLIGLAMDAKEIELYDLRTNTLSMELKGHLDYNFSIIFTEDN